jgi:hypothetical protein
LGFHRNRLEINTTTILTIQEMMKFFFSILTVEDVAGLLLSPQSIFGFDDEIGGRLPIAGPQGSLVCPGNPVPHARMEST